MSGVGTYLHINDGKCGMGYSGAEEEEEASAAVAEI